MIIQNQNKRDNPYWKIEIQDKNKNPIHLILIICLEYLNNIILG